jgi:DNA repair photolyase
MIHEIQAKTLLSSVHGSDDVFGIKYNFNLYRGCPHQCIYCDSRSECYGIEDFRDVLVKVNAPDLLAQELPRKRAKGAIGTGSMSDPYNPVERQYRLMQSALEVIARCTFPVHIITKSDLVVRDLDLLGEINRTQAVVCFSITTPDDALARIIEPGAPPPSARLAAMKDLAEVGIPTGAALMPILPFITDSEENVTQVVEQTAAHGGSFVIPWFGMSLRNRQREWYYRELDRHFPGLRQKYVHYYGERYGCSVPNNSRLADVFAQTIARLGLARCIPHYKSPIQQPFLI